MKMLTQLTLTVILQTSVILFAITSPLQPCPAFSICLASTGLQNSAQTASSGGGWRPGPRPLWTAMHSQESCPGIVYLVLRRSLHVISTSHYPRTGSQRVSFQCQWLAHRNHGVNIFEDNTHSSHFITFLFDTMLRLKVEQALTYTLLSYFLQLPGTNLSLTI